MLNKVLLIGNLVADPTLKYLPSGTPVCEFGIAYNRRYKVGQDWKEESHFFDVKSFGRLAENLSERLSKGYTVVIEGRLSQDRWTGQDGKNYSKVRIVAEAVRIIRKPKVEGEIEEEEIVDISEDIDQELKKLKEDKPFDDKEDEIPF
jgi:single-strand DNA-binding protein